MSEAMKQQNQTGRTETFLVGDIGGTNTRLALAEVSTSGAALAAVEIKESQRFPDLETAIADYAKDKTLPPEACLAVAGPIANGKGRVTNIGWDLDEEAIARACGFERVRLMNDFAALAFAVTGLGDSEKQSIKPGTARQGGPISVMGAGTGFGVAMLVPGADGYALVATEGGHASFAPTGEAEMRIWSHLRESQEHISNETLLSGDGLAAIFAAMTAFDGHARKSSAEEIARAASQDGSAAEAKALIMFFDILGSVAGDIALIQGATGGVYLAGGVVTKNAGWLKRSRFAERFSSKGIMSHYVKDIPVTLVASDYAALKGAALWAAKEHAAP
jgi:glucokinase